MAIAKGSDAVQPIGQPIRSSTKEMVGQQPVFKRVIATIECRRAPLRMSDAIETVAAPQYPEKTPPEDVHVDSRSGFSFDPAKAFESTDVSTIHDLGIRQRVYQHFESFAVKSGKTFMLSNSLIVPAPVCNRPDNIIEINEKMNAVKNAVDKKIKEDEIKKANGIFPDTPYDFPVFECPLGKITNQRLESLGITDEPEVFLVSPGTNKRGIEHWRKHHLDDWKKADAVKRILDSLAVTIWNPQASLKVVLGKNKQLCITSPDGKVVANLYKRGEKWEYDLMNVWDTEGSKVKK